MSIERTANGDPSIVQELYHSIVPDAATCMNDFLAVLRRSFRASGTASFRLEQFPIVSCISSRPSPSDAPILCHNRAKTASSRLDAHLTYPNCGVF